MFTRPKTVKFSVLVRATSALPAFLHFPFLCSTFPLQFHSPTHFSCLLPFPSHNLSFLFSLPSFTHILPLPTPSLPLPSYCPSFFLLITFISSPLTLHPPLPTPLTIPFHLPLPLSSLPPLLLSSFPPTPTHSSGPHLSLLPPTLRP